ncbi:MAG: hypothetical protein ACK4M2_01605 [Brevundimonas sp.]
MQTLEQRVAHLERAVLNLNEGVTAAHHELLDATRENHALSRLLMSVTALAARDAADPLKFMDEVRTMALGPLTHDELADTRERIELVLSKVEGALTKR